MGRTFKILQAFPNYLLRIRCPIRWTQFPTFFKSTNNPHAWLFLLVFSSLLPTDNNSTEYTEQGGEHYWLIESQITHWIGFSRLDFDHCVLLRLTTSSSSSRGGNHATSIFSRLSSPYYFPPWWNTMVGEEEWWYDEISMDSSSIKMEKWGFFVPPFVVFCSKSLKK